MPKPKRQLGWNPIALWSMLRIERPTEAGVALPPALDRRDVSFDERLSLLLEREKTEREQRRCVRLRDLAKLHLDATIDDLNFKASRGLDRSFIVRIASGQWIRDGQAALVSGVTGSGKSYLACALGHQACRLGISTRYYRVSRLLDELTLARGDGSYPKFIQRLARTWLLILDDWGLASLSGQGRHDLLEVLDDRYARRGTLLASQVPVDHWHDIVGDPTSGDGRNRQFGKQCLPDLLGSRNGKTPFAACRTPARPP